MSKKKSLSPTASLGACLDFASRVLSSTASVQEVCTKPVLAPMVVEAHRYGQQVMKHLDSGAPSDFRRLVGVLQDKLSQGSALASLVVADVTWDFKGLVKDTLEMELKELEGRVAKSLGSICAVFSISALTSRGEQAVIWFPQTNYQHLVDNSCIPKKRHYLVYVCPGKVKVVKNMGDLVKKLLEELPTMRESGSMFSVWAVRIGSKRSNQEEEQGPQPPLAELRKSHESGNNQNVDVDFVEKKNEFADPPSQQQEKALEQSNPPLISPPYSTHNHDEQENPAAYMLKCESSPKISAQQISSNELVPENRASHDREHGNENTMEPKSNENEEHLQHKYETTSSLPKAKGDDDSASVGRRHKPLTKRMAVSASLANFSIASRIVPNERGTTFESNVAWQSCDGKVIRKLIRPLHSDNNLQRVDSSVAVQEGRSENNCDSIDSPQSSELQDNDEQTKSLESREKVQHRAVQAAPAPVVNNVTPSIFAFASGSRIYLDDTNLEARRSIVGVQPQFCDLPECHSPLEINSGIDNDNHQMGNEGILTNTTPSQSNEEVRPVCAEVIEPSECAALPTVKLDVLLPLKPAYVPVNYKDKLGARIWWELEYTASKLKQEEQEERRQQNRRQQGKSRDNRACHLEPTGWSMKERNRALETKRVLSVSGEATSDDRQKLSHKISTTPPAISTEQQHADIGDTSSPNPVLVEQLAAQSYESPHQGTEQGTTVIPQKILSPSEKMSSTRQSFSRSKDITPRNRLADSVPIVRNSKSESNTTATASYAVPKAISEPTDFTAGFRNSPIATASSLVSTGKDQIRTSASTLECRQPEEPSILDSAIPTVSPGYKQKSITDNCNDSGSNEEGDDVAIQRIQKVMYKTLQNLSASTANEREELHVEVPPIMPFSGRERVPIRSRQTSSKMLSPDTDEPEQASPRIVGRRPSSKTPPISQIRAPVDILKLRGSVEASSRTSSSDTDELQQTSMSEPSNPPCLSPRASPSAPSQTKLPVDNTESRIPTSITREAAQVSFIPPPMATFIPIDEGQTTTRSATTVAGTREERLNELRKKKLQKLQQTRDMSLRQQKEKQQLRQTQKSSFLNSVYPKKASNRQLIQNALEYTLLAGGSMERERTAALQALAQSTCDNFIVLLKSSKELKFRALYENHVDRDAVIRIFSIMPSNSPNAPLKLDSCDTISQFFKYSSAKKQFLPVATRSFTVKTDACALVSQLSMKKKLKSSAIAYLL